MPELMPQPTDNHEILIGLTGGIASGKSTVSSMLAAKGLPIVDADKVARQVVEPGTKGLRDIANQFGPQMIDQNGQLDRHHLAEVVFDDPAKRRVLNQILQPTIKDEIHRQVESYRSDGQRIIVLDIPLLFETGYAADCDRIVVVNVKEDVQLKRLMARNGYNQTEALERIRAQMPLKAKAARADVVIDNNGNRQDLKKAVDAFMTTLPYDH